MWTIVILALLAVTLMVSLGLMMKLRRMEKRFETKFMLQRRLNEFLIKIIFKNHPEKKDKKKFEPCLN